MQLTECFSSSRLTCFGERGCGVGVSVVVGWLEAAGRLSYE